MTRIGRLADRMLSTLVPRATAAASACEIRTECRPCTMIDAKGCFLQYCNGVYRTGFCHGCGSC